MRLRQVALIAHRIDPVAAALTTVFGIKVAYRDPAVEVFGLTNVIMPVGEDFIEVLEPVRPDASGGRYLARRGGDAGYMVILQVDDAPAHRARLEALDVRVVARSDHHAYRFTHFHPGDCSGVLMSIDDTPGADWRGRHPAWPPAGSHWRYFESEMTLGLEAVTIQASDPQAAAERWSRLLDRPWTRSNHGFEIALDRGAVRFVPPVDADGTGVVGVDLRVTDPRLVTARAEAAGLSLRGGAVVIGGTAFTPLA